MGEQEKQTILLVINTLNTIQVSGKDNLNKQLACILALEKMVGVDSDQSRQNKA